MAEGTDTYKGLAVPLYGQSEIRANDATYDVITLTQYASGTGDFFVCQSENGTEKFVINYSGDLAGAVELTSTLTTGAGITISAGGLAAAGASSFTSTLACSGVVTLSGTVAGATSLTSTLTVATGFTLTAGDAVVTAGDVQITNGYYLRFTSWPTTAPVTGTTLGDVFLITTSTNVQIGVTIGDESFRYVNTTSA